MRSQHIPSTETLSSKRPQTPTEKFESAERSCAAELRSVPANAERSLLFGPGVGLALAARADVPPERLLKTLKQLLRETPRLNACEPEAREQLTKDLVTVAIEVFYAQPEYSRTG